MKSETRMFFGIICWWDVFTQLVVRLFVMEWYSFLCLLLFQLWNSFADNLFNKQNCRNHFLCHPASLRMFATTWKQTNWSGFPKFPLNPLFPLTSNFLRWGNIWSLDSFPEDTTNTIANINLTAALIGLLWIQVLGSFCQTFRRGDLWESVLWWFLTLACFSTFKAMDNPTLFWTMTKIIGRLSDNSSPGAPFPK